MEFEISPNVLLEVLKRLVPHKRQLIKKGPLVTLIAEGDALDVTGQFENTWSIPAKVISSGSCTVDIAAFSLSLNTYKARVPLGFVVVSDGLKFGTTKLKLHDISQKNK